MWSYNFNLNTTRCLVHDKKLAILITLIKNIYGNNKIQMLVDVEKFFGLIIDDYPQNFFPEIYIECKENIKNNMLKFLDKNKLENKDISKKLINSLLCDFDKIIKRYISCHIQGVNYMLKNILLIILVLCFIIGTVLIIKNQKYKANITCANCKNLILTRSSFKQKILVCTEKDYSTWWRTHSITNPGANKCKWFKYNK